MIRVVPDANILVSGFADESGLPAALIERWRADEFQLVTSQHIIDEITRGWTKPYWRNRFSQAQIDRAIDLLEQDADVTPITVQVTGVATHAADDVVLATAVSGNAGFLVTGDIPLRGVGSHEGIVILTPREFFGSNYERNMSETGYAHCRILQPRSVTAMSSNDCVQRAFVPGSPAWLCPSSSKGACRRASASTSAAGAALARWGSRSREGTQSAIRPGGRTSPGGRGLMPAFLIPRKRSRCSANCLLSTRRSYHDRMIAIRVRRG